MSRRMVNLTLDTLDDLPRRCRGCVFWELSPSCGERACEYGDSVLEKEAWVSATLLDWGGCGRIAYEGTTPAGFVMYASPKYVPRAAEFPTAPVSPDAALIMTAHVLPAYAASGVGRALIQAVAQDLTKRGIRAVEAYGDERGEPEACLTPADFFRAVGFKTVRPHAHYPLLRLELRTALDWGVGVGALESAVEQWQASVNLARSQISRS